MRVLRGEHEPPAVEYSRRNILIRAYDGLFHHDIWNIGIVQGPISMLEPGTRPSVQWLMSLQKSRYLADPFATSIDDRIYLLCEEYDYQTRKGRIVCFEISEGRLVSGPRVVFEPKFHVSHPYLLQHKGEIYLVPETHRIREAGLYRAQQFPVGWRKVATLLSNFAAVDTTIFQHDGRWWLTCTDNEQGSSLKLFAWHSKDLFGPWVPHADNPVKVDARSSRPGGTPFVRAGFLYRPAQDCSRTYGGRIVINRIVTLTSEKFSEEPVSVIEPDSNSPYPDGIHTVSAAGGFTFIDGKRVTFNKTAFAHVLAEDIAKVSHVALRSLHIQ
jgi:hypothetical protein